MEIQALRQNPLTISVSADAKVSVTPDIGSITVGVASGRQTSAKAATAAVRKNMQNTIDAITKLGIETKDIATESFYLQPEYDYTTNGQVPRGFQATQTLRIKVRDLDTTGDVITAATEAGANQVGSVSFDIDDPEAARGQAREQAIVKAKAKAEVLAKSLGMSLGRMTAFDEGGNVPRPVPMMARAAVAEDAAMAESMPMPTGEQELTSIVTLTYELR